TDRGTTVGGRVCAAPLRRRGPRQDRGDGAGGRPRSSRRPRRRRVIVDAGAVRGGRRAVLRPGARGAPEPDLAVRTV
ncbi:hypothetical protein RZS08_51850, partial [Arthrospira platensis SPKY1]|nr:hypothetical protein [Arthrospira platensis SPKY1]